MTRRGLVLFATLVVAALNGCGANPAENKVEEGRRFHFEGDPETAIACFTEAICLDRFNWSAHHYRGDAYSKQESFELADADYTEAIRLNPGSSSLSYMARGRVRIELKRFDEAIADFSVAIHEDADLAAGYAERGRASFGKGIQLKNPGFIELAIKDYTEAIRLDKYGGKNGYRKLRDEAKAALRPSPN